MENGLRNAIIGAVGLGVAGAGAFTVTSLGGPDPEENASVAAVDSQGFAGEICLKADIDFLPGDQKGCFSQSELASWEREPLVDPSRGPLAVRMTHPSDASRAAAECRTCRDFAEYRYEGWFAMTARDMRREAFFRRACGVIDMLRRARPAEANYFGEDGLGAGDVASVSAARLLRLGADPEASATPADPEILSAGPGSWRVSAGGQTTYIDEVAALDFDGDGVAEILTFFSAGPDRATARVSEIALMEKDAAEAAVTLTPVDFTRWGEAGRERT